MLKSHNIEINPKYYKEFGMETLVGIIKHELCHYHLHIEGKGYKHRDLDFKQLMNKVGAPRFCQPLPPNQQNQTILLYRCEKCEKQYRRKRKVDTRKYVCGRCRGKLIYMGREVFVKK
ncbi:SprT-like protein [Bacillus oleivorans]|uniref:SprT-like protein n=1 Tax=Bacillus oleivorans TaxID=1448271 RepID=A0A285D5P4_9BACI|nr:SprT-like protein [Bacillus oleivorans]